MGFVFSLVSLDESLVVTEFFRFVDFVFAESEIQFQTHRLDVELFDFLEGHIFVVRI
jgi:hypothetical protein